VAGAVAAGMWAIGFTGATHCGPGSGQRLAQAGAVEVAANAAELGTMLDGALSKLRGGAPPADNTAGG